MQVQKQWGLDLKGLNEQLKTITNSDTPYAVPRNSVRIGCDTTGGAITVNLPPPEEMVGRSIAVYLDTDGGTDITIVGEGFSDITLNTVDDYVIMWSSGKDWHDLAADGNT